MADYQEATLTGTEWRRARLVQINNERATPPTITFSEEVVTILSNGRTVSTDGGQIVVSYDPTAIIDLYDPATLQKIGATITHQELYGILFGAYFTSATARDAAPPPPMLEGA